MRLAQVAYSTVPTALLGGTPGQRVLGLRVVDIPSGEPYRQAIGVRFLWPGTVGCAVALLSVVVAVIFAGRDPQGRSIRDQLAGTMIIVQ
jgi:uncharacterized RDD family membrane protein YckC